MVKVRKATEKDIYNAGIHLLNPDYQTLLNAREDAQAKGFRTIWVHRGLTLPRMKRRLKKVI
jgi:hypothetical protein